MQSRNLAAPPPHKRQRLSSPDYDHQFGDLSQDDLAACSEIEARLSQRQPPSQPQKRLFHKVLSAEEKQKRLRALEAGLRGEVEGVPCVMTNC